MGSPIPIEGTWAPGARWQSCLHRLEWSGEGTVPTTLVRSAELSGDAYRLVTNAQSIQIEAANEVGATYALLTLHQLQGDSAVEIQDEPAFPNRGVMLDISRCKVPTLDSLFELIDWLSRFKINQFQLYTEHAFAYAGHETVWRDATPYTAADIRRIDDFCHERFIELVPNQNSFGHFERWIKHSEYRHFAESPDGFDTPWGTRRDVGSVLRPNDATLALLDDLYTQLLPNFRSRQFNIGCDETFELGQGHSAAECESRGRERVYLDFLIQIHERASRDGHVPMFWGDIIHESPELLADLPRPITALEWGYEAEHPFGKRCADYATHNVPFYVCPGTSSWRSIVGRTSNLEANVAAAVREGLRHGAVGCLMTDWGDVGHTQTYPVALPGYLLGAAAAWNPDTPELGPALDAYAFGVDGVGEWWLELGRIQDLLTSRSFANSSPFFHLMFSKQHKAWQMPEEEAQASLARFRELEEAFEGFAGVRFEDEIRLSLLQLRFALTRHTELLPRLLERHKDVWLQRNRAGGVTESLEFFTAESG